MTAIQFFEKQMNKCKSKLKKIDSNSLEYANIASKIAYYQIAILAIKKCKVK